MARFSDNPLKSTPAGNEFIPATDPSTGDDVSFNPAIITQYAAQHMAVANGSSNGLIDAASYAKLLALDTQAQTNIRVGQLAEVAIPMFFSSPADGAYAIYQHVLDVPWQVAFDYLYCSAGSTNVTVTRNGTSITGLANNGATTTSAKYTASGGSSNYTLYQGDVLGISLSGTTGNCANLYASLRANAVISP